MIGMRENRRKADWPVWVASVAIAILLMLSVYAGGYLCLGKPNWCEDPGLPLGVIRYYPTPTLSGMYKPAGGVEAFFTGYWVDILYEGELLPPPPPPTGITTSSTDAL